MQNLSMPLTPAAPVAPGLAAQPASQRDVVTYRLDGMKQLVAVGGAWDRFALENGAPELADPTPIGRPLRSFISDATTVLLYDALFDKARTTGRPIEIPIRCDAPRVRRELQLHIVPGSDGFLVSTVLVSATPRELFAQGGAHRQGPLEIVRSCSWCNRVHAGGRWVEIEDAVTLLRLFCDYPPPDISHGICDPCLARIESLL